jgi:hypothetical protein
VAGGIQCQVSVQAIGGGASWDRLTTDLPSATPCDSVPRATWGGAASRAVLNDVSDPSSDMWFVYEFGYCPPPDAGALDAGSAVGVGGDAAVADASLGDGGGVDAAWADGGLSDSSADLADGGWGDAGVIDSDAASSDAGTMDGTARGGGLGCACESGLGLPATFLGVWIGAFRRRKLRTT